MEELEFTQESNFFRIGLNLYRFCRKYLDESIILDTIELKITAIRMKRKQKTNMDTLLPTFKKSFFFIKHLLQLTPSTRVPVGYQCQSRQMY